MKHVRKALAFVVALVMAFAIVTPALAQTVDSQKGGNGSIKITNAAKGVDYAVYKLFDATVSTDGTSIAYTGDIPTSLSAYFTKNAQGNITYTTEGSADGNELSANARDAISNWVKNETAVASTTSDGSDLTFSNLQYGYYVVTTSQGDQAISVDSTKPNAEIHDKNTTTPINNPSKSVDEPNVKVGDNVTYTIKFGTANYVGQQQILKYIISDNFASGALETPVTVNSIKVNGTAIETKQFTNGTIEIPWAENGTSLYNNGAEIEIKYTAKVAQAVNIAGAGNTNAATITYTLDGDGQPTSETVNATIKSYAFAIKKVDQKGADLKGATFELPFYVQKTPASDGAYVYAGTVAKDGLVNRLTTPDNGLIIVKGVKSGDPISFTEYAAPDGYNKLTAPVTVTPEATTETTTSKTTYYDKDGNKVNEQTTNGFSVLVSINNIAATPVVVVNKTGTEMPSTGGIGTTIFYIVGGVMVAGAAIFLLTKRRVSAE